MSCGVGRRHSSDLALLWLCCRPAATTPIGLLAWEPPNTMGAVLKKKKKKKKKNQANNINHSQKTKYKLFLKHHSLITEMQIKSLWSTHPTCSSVTCSLAHPKYLLEARWASKWSFSCSNSHLGPDSHLPALGAPCLAFAGCQEGRGHWALCCPRENMVLKEKAS